MELAEPAATEISSSSEQHKKKQMKLNDVIRLYMTNAFTADHEDEKNSKMFSKNPAREEGAMTSKYSLSNLWIQRFHLVEIE